MTRISFVNRLGLRLLLLLTGLVLAGCSGSRLGDTLGRNLEPDPQLSAEADDAETDTPAVSPDPTRNEPKTIEPAPEASPSGAADESPDEPVAAGDYTDLATAPEEIQPYLSDLVDLDLLKIRPPATSPAASSNGSGAQSSSQSKPNEFQPNQVATRREYARWLLATNNRFYNSQRNRKVRPGVSSSTPVFQDVKANDSDFEAIQGLAEAGIIPSPLTGSSTTLTFRPDAPLTRKDLVLWKVPLDTRQPLPQATPAAVAEAWGFQDAAKIEPRALQAVLADYQNGDFANILRAFGYTTLFQPDKAATRAEAAAALWRFGNSTEGITAEEILNPGSSDPEESDTGANSGV
ncbi:MAG: S-layer homology domain-containing protein [Phormidesmis sp.]